MRERFGWVLVGVMLAPAAIVLVGGAYLGSAYLYTGYEPEWVCWTPEGLEANGTRAQHDCLEDPYNQETTALIVALAVMGHIIVGLATIRIAARLWRRRLSGQKETRMSRWSCDGACDVCGRPCVMAAGVFGHGRGHRCGDHPPRCEGDCGIAGCEAATTNEEVKP